MLIFDVLEIRLITRASDGGAVRRPMGTKTGLKHLLPNLGKTTKEIQLLMFSSTP